MEPSTPPADAPLILVADDVAANVELLFDQLHVLGFRAIAAADGPSALAACFEHRPDLCILDVSMPAGDLGVDDRSTGFEVCRRIKRDPRTKRIPVIFVTALNDTTDRVKAIEAGGDDFLTKPHNRLVLGARVRSLLKLKAATDSLEDTLRKLREVEKMRDDLMKMIVHDLKTPLTSVLASIEMLADGDFGAINPDQRRMLLDAEGKAVYPGFIDAHAHFLGYAQSLISVDFGGTQSWEECLERIRNFIREKSLAPGSWIVGRGWDQNDWPVKEFPDRRKLDSLFPGYPIFLERVDGHAAIVSQLALDKAGVKPGQELVGGKVETRDGRLTGILVDNATDLVGRIIPSPDAPQMKDALMQAQQNCFAVGLTTIVDCGLSRFDVAAIDSLQKKGDLKMRMVVMLSDDPGNYEYYLSRGPYKTERLNVNAFKLYADGALG